MEWQPIETAPKNGVEIVLWCENCNSLIHPAKWTRDHWREYATDEFGRASWCRLDPYEKPSHWMVVIPPGSGQVQCRGS